MNKSNKTAHKKDKKMAQNKDTNWLKMTKNEGKKPKNWQNKHKGNII